MIRLHQPLIWAGLAGLAAYSTATAGRFNYPVVDTGQERCYDASRETTCPKPGDAFFGQDAQYQGNRPGYRDNADGTVSDLVTGLMWQKDPGPKKTFQEAAAGASACRVAGYDDWRLPTIKELYSLILFSGIDPDPRSAASSNLRPFIDPSAFSFKYGDAANHERIIDSQYATSTRYVGKTMRGNDTMFGVNFADGRIKGYPISHRGRMGRMKTYYVMYVRGNPDYGKNKFHDNGDGTVTDRATGLTWMKRDSGHLKAGGNRDGKLNWGEALEWAEGLEYAKHSDWRLPNVKELQSIVDYTRSPSTTGSATIDPVFEVSSITNEGNHEDYPCYWSSTTHARRGSGAAASYVAFGQSLGWMPNHGGGRQLLDVHGAGSQRSDPKAGDPSRLPYGRGPQGDVVRIYNFARAVRDGQSATKAIDPKVASKSTNPDQPGKIIALTTHDWPQFRGPHGNNISPETKAPITWSDSKNLLWKTTLPGPGSSSPIVAGDRVFVTCYSGYAESRSDPGRIEDLKRHLVCINSKDGKILWEQTVPAEMPEDPYRGYITEHGYASSTPVTDGERVYVFFGKTGALAFDMDGRQLWKVGLGKETGPRGWGSASSPILHKDLVIVTAAEESQSIRALDKATGREAWKAEAAMMNLIFNTPIIVDAAKGRMDLILGVPNELWGLNPDTGKLLWHTETNIPGNVTPSVFAVDGTVYAYGGYPNLGSMAVRLGGKGDVSDSHVVWTSRISPYIPSPVYFKGHFHWVNRQGFAQCQDAKTGEEVYRERLQSRSATPKVYASPVVVGDKLYVTTRNAGTFILQAGPQFKQLAQNEFASDETDFNGTPAFSRDRIYLRSNRHLYAVGSN